jgi:probable rRNA maturation factor
MYHSRTRVATLLQDKTLKRSYLVGLPVEVIIQDHYFSLETGIATISSNQWTGWLERWLEIMQEELPEAIGYELSLRLTNDQEIQQLNHQYRQKDQPTDVLAFAALEGDYPLLAEEMAEEPLYLGDVVISVDTAQRQAIDREHSLELELAWLAAHGLLHLLGWDHPDDESLGIMLKQQEVLLHSVNLNFGDISKW